MRRFNGLHNFSFLAASYVDKHFLHRPIGYLPPLETFQKIIILLLACLFFGIGFCAGTIIGPLLDSLFNLLLTIDKIAG